MAPPRRSSRLGINPGESLARYGSIAGAGLQPKEVSRSVDVMNQIREARGEKPSYTARDFLTDKTQREMQYGRQADTQKFTTDLDRTGQALDAGAKIQIGPDGIPRIQYGDIGMKDDQGRTILSTMLPSMSAVAPTLRELGGDIKRGIMGGTAFTRAAGLPNPSDAQGIMALASKSSPLLNLLGVDFSPETGPSTRSMAEDYVTQTGMFTPKVPQRIETVGIESIPDATDSPAFRDLTPDEILEQPLESIDEIVSAFRQGLLLDELYPSEGFPFKNMPEGPVKRKFMEYGKKYPEIYYQILDQEI